MSVRTMYIHVRVWWKSEEPIRNTVRVLYISDDNGTIILKISYVKLVSDERGNWKGLNKGNIVS